MPTREVRIGGVLLGILALGLCEQRAPAQSLDDRPVGIFLGYTFADLANPTPTDGRLHEQGLDFGVYVKQNHWLSWRAEVTAGGSILGPGDDYELGGPEFTAHTGRAVFFAHALLGRGSAGGGLFSTNGSGFAMAFGGGADVRVTSRVSVRLIDVDYLPGHFSGPTFEGLFTPPGPHITSWNNNRRISCGVIVRVGRKS